MSWTVIDISYYQSISNYTTLANAVDGIIMRCGYRGYGSSGSLQKDTALETHYSGLNGKTKIGYYWFSQAISDAEAIEEADFVIDTLLSGKTNDMPIYFDSEIASASGDGRADRLSKAARTQYCITWINRIKARGYRAGVYASESWFYNNLDYNQILATGASIWIAKYSSNPPSQSTYDAWQFTDAYPVSGLGSYDASYFYKDVANWGGGGGIPVTGIDMNINEITLNVGGTYWLTYTIYPWNATNKNVTWSSSNNSIATVNNGTVTGVSTGTCVIEVKTVDGGFTAHCTVNVGTKVTGVTLNTNTLNLDIADHSTLVASIQPPDATVKDVTWSTSDSSIANITPNGLNCLVSPQRNGTCTVTVTTVDGGKTATCTVNVTTKIQGIEISKTSTKIEKESTETLTYSFIPRTATPKPVTWRSSNTSIATVDNNGVITAIKPGKCNITVSVETFTATCVTSVVVYPTNISLNTTKINQHILDETEPETLTVTFEPEDCTEKDLVWTSTNIDICEYDINTGKIKYNGDIGSCYIIATDVKDHKAQCNVNVYKRMPKPNIPIVMDVTEHEITVEPLEAHVYSIDGGLNWQYSNTFDNLETNFRYYINQKVPGTGYYIESEPSDYAEITTKDIVHVESVELNIHELEITTDDEPYKFEATILPENAAIQTVIYGFSNTSVAMFYDNELRPLDAGEGVVTVTSIDRGKKDYCNVIVRKKWKTPGAPDIIDIKKDSVTLKKESPYQEFSIDGENWRDVLVFDGLEPNTSYRLVSKIVANGYMNESNVSEPAVFTTPAEDIPEGISPAGVILNANTLYFDINKNRYATLSYTVVPQTASNNCVEFYSENSNIITVSANGELKATGIGKCIVTVKTIDGGKTAFCKCYVYEKLPQPDPPTVRNVDIHSVELNPVQNCQYSIDGETWQNSTLFENLTEDSYYAFYQRYKGVGDYQPPSEPSRSLVVKTLPASKPGGTSPSGYSWGQKVEVNKIPVFPSPYSIKSNFKLTGIYYIFSINESNHRIRLVDNEDFIDVPGHSLGWVNISDLRLIIDEIYVGDKVVVTGDINTNVDGSGTSIHKDKATMFVTDIIIGTFDYGFGVTDVPGKFRVGFAKRDMITKYNDIIISDD